MEVGGSSMEPTFSGGARLLAVRGLEPRRGRIVVLRPRAGPRPPGASTYLVKRVAAGPGDPVPPSVRAAVRDDIVPAGQFVVLGDNSHSVDSRTWGFVPRSDIVGAVVRVMAVGPPP